MNMKESMVIPRSLMTATNRLSMAEKGEVLDAIMRYGFNSDEYTGDSTIVAMIFDLMKPYIDENQKRYDAIVERNRVNGKRGGRPKSNKNPEKPRETQQNPVGYFGNPEKPSRTQTNLDTDTDTDTDTGLFLKKEIKEKKPSSKKGNQDLRKTDPIHRSPLDGKEKGCAEKEKPAGRYVVVGQLGAVLLAEQGWIEAMCMNLHKERDYIERRIGEFVGELVVSGCDGRDLSDAKRHFRNWLRKIENLPNQNNGNQQQRGCTDEELIAAVYEGYARAHTKQPWEK